jgi:hypothetical protein
MSQSHELNQLLLPSSSPINASDRLKIKKHNRRVRKDEQHNDVNKKTDTSCALHPFALAFLMTAFAYPAVSLSHYTDNLAVHTQIKHETFGLALSFCIFSFLILIVQTSRELDGRKKVLERGLAKKSRHSVDFPDSLNRIGQLCFILGLIVAGGGAFGASLTIGNLDSSIPSQASTISKLTAALNYFLIFGAVLMLIGYMIIRAAISRVKIVDKYGKEVPFQKGDPVYQSEIESKRLTSAGSIQGTHSGWIVFIMGIGTMNAFFLKDALTVPKGALIVYSIILFFSAAIIALPKVKHAQNMKNKLCELLGQEQLKLKYGGEGLDDHDLQTGVEAIKADMARLTKYENIYSHYLPYIGMGLLGAGIAAACYGDPLWGTMFIVFSMVPLLIAGILASYSSKGIGSKVSNVHLQRPMMFQQKTDIEADDEQYDENEINITPLATALTNQ